MGLGCRPPQKGTRGARFRPTVGVGAGLKLLRSPCIGNATCPPCCRAIVSAFHKWDPTGGTFEKWRTGRHEVHRLKNVPRRQDDAKEGRRPQKQQLPPAAEEPGGVDVGNRSFAHFFKGHPCDGGGVCGGTAAQNAVGSFGLAATGALVATGKSGGTSVTVVALEIDGVGIQKRVYLAQPIKLQIE